MSSMRGWHGIDRWAEDREQRRQPVRNSIRVDLTHLADEITCGPSGQFFAATIKKQNHPPRVDDEYRQLGLAKPFGKAAAGS
jgi:hypothetical protein